MMAHKTIIHGTVQGYWRKCRCTKCKAAHSEYQRERRESVLDRILSDLDLYDLPEI